MFILYAVALGILVGLLSRGTLLGLAQLEVRWAPAIVGGLAFQIALFVDPVAGQVGAMGPPLYVASTLVVAAAVVRNWRIAGIPLVIAGAALNMAAILANGGYMPSTADALTTAGKTLTAVYTNSSVVPHPALWFLTDIFAIPRWVPLANVFSVGDILVALGIATAVVVAMRRPLDPPAGSPLVSPRTGLNGGTGMGRTGGR